MNSITYMYSLLECSHSLTGHIVCRLSDSVSVNMHFKVATDFQNSDISPINYNRSLEVFSICCYDFTACMYSMCCMCSLQVVSSS